MSKYQFGKIYKITSKNTNEIYIGSTIKKYLCSRLASHKCEYNKWVNNEHHYLSSFNIIFQGDVTIELIENYPCNSNDELIKREQYWINKNKNICINDRNAHGRNMKKLKKSRILADKKYREKNEENIKKYKLAHALIPVNCYYCDIISNKGHICRHEKSKQHLNNVKVFEKIFAEMA